MHENNNYDLLFLLEIENILYFCFPFLKLLSLNHSILVKNTKFDYYKAIVSLLYLTKFVISVLIAYFVIWGFIIEPRKDINYQGLGDFADLVMGVILVIPFFLINYVIWTFERLKHFSNGRNQKIFQVFKWFKSLWKEHEIIKTVHFSNYYVKEALKDKNYIYLITGLSSCFKNLDAYCCGWTLNSNGSDIDIYQIIYKKGKPEFNKIKTIAIGSECGFSLVFKKNNRTTLKIYCNENELWELIYKTVSTKTTYSFGLSLDYFEKCALKGKVTFLKPHF